MQEKLRTLYRYYRRKIVLLFQISKRLHRLADAVKYYTVNIYWSFDEYHIFLFGGGLAFSILLCIIPFVLILFWVLGSVLSSDSVAIQVNNLIDTAIPYDDYSDFVKEILQNRIKELIEFKNTAGIVGIAGLLFTASGFSGAIRTILNTIYGMKIDVNFFLGKLRDFALILVAMVLILAASLIFPIIDLLRQLSNQFPDLQFLTHGIFQKLFTTTFSLVLIVVVFSLLYHWVPIIKIKKRAVVVGAIWAAALWEIAKQGFGYYLYHFATYGKVYGTYALIVVIAFWLYYSATVFVFGAVIAKLYHNRLVEAKE
jgi:membrane protein